MLSERWKTFLFAFHLGIGFRNISETFCLPFTRIFICQSRTNRTDKLEDQFFSLVEHLIGLVIMKNDKILLSCFRFGSSMPSSLSCVCLSTRFLCLRSIHHPSLDLIKSQIRPSSPWTQCKPNDYFSLRFFTKMMIFMIEFFILTHSRISLSMVSPHVFFVLFLI